MTEQIRDYYWNIAYYKQFSYLWLNFKAKLEKTYGGNDYKFFVWDWNDDASDDIFTLEGINKNNVNVYYFNEYLDKFLDWIS